jgi:DNA-binding NarL/FixJ family response regulator
MIHNAATTVKTINAGVVGKLLKPVSVQELYSAI